MKRLYIISILSFLLFAVDSAYAQTAKSLFWRSDSLQVSEIVSETGADYKPADVGFSVG